MDYDQLDSLPGEAFANGEKGALAPGLTAHCVRQSEEKTSSNAEPVLCEEVIFEDEEFIVKKLWHWNVRAIFEDEETGLMKGILAGQTFNYDGRSAFCTPEGKRCSDLEFDYLDCFYEGLALVQPAGKGFGYVDERMQFQILPEYEEGEAFKAGLAKVKKDGVWLHVDRHGREIIPVNGRDYVKTCDFSEGLCRVSTFKSDCTDFETGYPTDAGIWGYINEKGEEVIPPQYIYADDFEAGIAIVCKGEWIHEEKWDAEYKEGNYWAEGAQWGGIDRNGREVIPFIFDEIRCFQGTREIFIAHFGCWKYGKWGVIDRQGNWLAEPFFEDIHEGYGNGLFAFYEENRWEREDALMGIFDLKENRLLFEPRFLEVKFLKDGEIKVKLFHEALNRTIEQMIDRNGTACFDSEYTSISPLGDFYEVAIRDEKGIRRGVIEKDGTVVFLCEDVIPWNSISLKRKRFVFVRDEMEGVKTFDGEVLIPPIYYGITGLEEPFLSICVETQDGCREGLFTQTGKMVVPPIYDNITVCRNGRYICSGKEGCDVMQLLKKTELFEKNGEESIL